jgi:hypothetical protein
MYSRKGVYYSLVHRARLVCTAARAFNSLWCIELGSVAPPRGRLIPLVHRARLWMHSHEGVLYSVVHRARLGCTAARSFDTLARRARLVCTAARAFYS